MNCWHCGAVLDAKTGERISSRATCPQCDADLHSCRGCRHHDPRVHHECTETVAEWVKVKDRNNYCDYFAPTDVAGSAAATRPAANARSAFDSLFKS